MRELLLPLTDATVNVRSTAGPGTPEAPVFVLVHGIGMSHRYLDRLHNTLAVTGAVHSVDLPGFGRSPKPERGVSIEQYADYLGELLPMLSERPVVLVGHSMGAQFATETAVRHPALVAHLVLIGGVTDPTRDSVLRQALDLGRDTLKEPFGGTMIVMRDYLLCGPRWYLATLRPMLAYRTDLRLRDVCAPTLVIRGKDDPVSRHEWGVRLAAQASQGKLLELPGRHLVHFSAAAATAAGIREYARAFAPGPASPLDEPAAP
ncbi:alpha/beta hydrolase [Cryobacterium adonitolivorans]|uniref:Alpha/beta hydrolase n=1 Tax=Cryobacterium adonitolivorans TaxID=1259189 RepID=A0A4R8W1P1_9MICO|nr:alpha/beta hydrolase [Cryobacterium adonitolivorans]TFB98719.1 alpha/beta hydrolase [Cryobacterium adonitolivorans]